jgi:hypothetical protein
MELISIPFVSCDSIPPAWNYYRFDPPIVWEPQWGNKVGFSVAVGFDDSMWVDTTCPWPHSWVGSSPSGPWEVYDQGNFMIRITVQGKYTAVPWETDEKIPKTFSLSNNYPNPFNSQTTIEYALPKESKVKIVIYNVLGQRVKTLLDQREPLGYKRVVWDGKNQNGETISSGIYFYRIEAEGFVQSKKMLLLK